MIAALSVSKRANEDVHSFLVRYVFTTAPTPDEQALAEHLLNQVTADPNAIKDALRPEIAPEPPRKKLRLSEEDIDLTEVWGIPDVDKEAVDDNYDGNELTIEHSVPHITQSEPDELAPEDQILIDRYQEPPRTPITDTKLWRDPPSTIRTNSSESASESDNSDSAQHDADITRIAQMLDKSFGKADSEGTLSAGPSTSDGFLTPRGSISTAFEVGYNNDD